MANREDPVAVEVIKRLERDNAALLEALEAYVAVYRRVMEQANKIDSDVWYAATKAEQKARAAIAQAKGDK